MKNKTRILVSIARRLDFNFEHRRRGAGQSSVSQRFGLGHRVYQDETGNGNGLFELRRRSLEARAGSVEKRRADYFLQSFDDRSTRLQ